jgi:hypothetical protein
MNLFLHVGYFKTGSSALQTFFALNHELLSQHKCLYPCDGSSRTAATQGNLFYGNGNELYLAARREKNEKKQGEISRVINKYILRALAQDAKSIVLSSENLFTLLANQSDFSNFILKIKDTQICRINILLFIRDPFEHAKSWYGECVKWGKTDLPMSSWAASYTFPKDISSMLNCVDQNNDFVSIAVRNYSLCKNNLIEIVIKWLGISLPALKNRLAMPDHLANRSLTRFELEICKLLNLNHINPRHFSKALSSIPVDSKDAGPSISLAFVNHIRASFEPYRIHINQALPGDEAMQLIDPITRSQEDEDGSWTVNIQELSAVAKSLSLMVESMLLSQTTTPKDIDIAKLLTPFVVEFLRDHAVAGELSGDISLAHRVQLMSLAHLGRPSGPLIKRKLKQWTDKLLNQENSGNPSQSA